MRRDHRIVVLGFGAVTCVAAMGCGSDESSLDTPPTMSCGTGTVAVGGECVPIDGGPGGAAGSGGAGGQGGSGGAAGGSTGGTDAGIDAPDEGGGGGPGPEDDPCPAQPVELDCSDQCGGPTALCAGATCSTALHSSAVLNDVGDYPYVFRTPSHPGVDPACAEACQDQSGSVPPVYGVSVTVNSPEDPSKLLKVTVGPPWRIEISSEGKPYYCLDWSPAQGCEVATRNSFLMVMILTDDPNAPARNVVLEQVEKPGSCP